MATTASLESSPVTVSLIGEKHRQHSTKHWTFGRSHLLKSVVSHQSNLLRKQEGNVLNS